MEIKEGKRYWTRCGWITAPIMRNIGTTRASGYWVCGSVSWFECGRFLSSNLSDQDLVAEYTGPELVPPLIPEVGKRYVDEKEGVTPPVKAVHDSKVWFDGSFRGAYRWFSELKREYQGKDDPINKETPCAS